MTGGKRVKKQINWIKTLNSHHAEPTLIFLWKFGSIDYENSFIGWHNRMSRKYVDVICNETMQVYFRTNLDGEDKQIRLRRRHRSRLALDTWTSGVKHSSQNLYDLNIPQTKLCKLVDTQIEFVYRSIKFEYLRGILQFRFVNINLSRLDVMVSHHPKRPQEWAVKYGNENGSHNFSAIKGSELLNHVSELFTSRLSLMPNWSHAHFRLLQI